MGLPYSEVRTPLFKLLLRHVRHKIKQMFSFKLLETCEIINLSNLELFHSGAGRSDHCIALCSVKYVAL